MALIGETLFGEGPDDVRGYGRHSTGILPSHILKREIRARRLVVASEECSKTRCSPRASTCGWARSPTGCAQASSPVADASVDDKLARVSMHTIDITDGAVLEAGCVYVIPLLERLELRDRISGIANPKSSTGRLDVFTRLITDRAQAFDKVERAIAARCMRKSRRGPSPFWCARARV